MNFTLLFTEEAEKHYLQLKKSPALKNQHKAVKKSLELMGSNLKHPSLNTHKFSSLSAMYGKDVFESYAQNRTPGAFRIFWEYGPLKGQITIIAITPHP